MHIVVIYSILYSALLTGGICVGSSVQMPALVSFRERERLYDHEVVLQQDGVWCVCVGRGEWGRGEGGGRGRGGKERGRERGEGEGGGERGEGRGGKGGGHFIEKNVACR